MSVGIRLSRVSLHAALFPASKLVSHHRARFISLAMIGGVLILAGLAFQPSLTSGLRAPSFLWYIAETLSLAGIMLQARLRNHLYMTSFLFYAARADASLETSHLINRFGQTPAGESRTWQSEGSKTRAASLQPAAERGLFPHAH